MQSTVEHHPLWQRAQAFAAQSRAQPGNFDLVNTTVQCLGQLAHDATAVPPPMPLPDAIPVGEWPLVSVVICSIDPAKFATVTADYRARFPAGKLEIIGIHDAKGLNEAYNRGLDQARGDIVVFSHDDIRLLNDNFAARMMSHLRQFDLIGVAGTTLATGPTFGWTGYPHSHGWVAHPVPGGAGFMAGTYTLDTAPVPGAQMLDGLWFAARTVAARRIRFDDQLPGFHGYDADFTYRCHLGGLRVAICPGLWIMHASQGNFGEAWQRASGLLLKKHPALRAAVGRHLHCFGARVADTEEVTRFYGWLSALPTAGIRS